MSITTRRERREQERERRLRRAGAPAPKRGGRGPRPLVVAAGIVIVLAALIAGGRAAGIFGPATTPAGGLNDPKYGVAGEVIGTHEPDEGKDHIPTAQKATYKTDPPTSGAHWNQPGVAAVPWGIKDATLPNEAIVHNLEHGGIVIFYQDLAPDDLAKLRELVRTMSQNGYPKIVLEPYSFKDAQVHVALSAWRWSLKLPGFDDAAIVKFVKAHYEGPDAPEPQTL